LSHEKLKNRTHNKMAATFPFEGLNTATRKIESVSPQNEHHLKYFDKY
jgi:hypothetical protein